MWHLHRHSVLIADAADCPLGPMALRLSRIGIDPTYTNDLDEAILLAHQEDRKLGAVAFPASLSGEEVDRLIKALGDRLDFGPEAMVPVGTRPNAEGVLALRERGIRWAVWEPCDDADLRFVLAHVIERRSPDDSRLAARVPAGMIDAKLYKGAMGRPAQLIDLSTGGAFLGTERPLPEGSGVSLEVALAEGMLRLRALVRWTRRDSDLERGDLLPGMGVEFTEMTGEQLDLLRRFVREQLVRYVVSSAPPF